MEVYCHEVETIGDLMDTPGYPEIAVALEYSSRLKPFLGEPPGRLSAEPGAGVDR